MSFRGSYLKEAPFKSEAWLRAVANIPCVFCQAPAPDDPDDGAARSQAAHRNEGKAGGRKLMDDCLTAALCPRCHSEIDQGKGMLRETRRAEMDRAIVLTLRELVRRGVVVVAGPK